jgi:hypothetical protein
MPPLDCGSRSVLKRRRPPSEWPFKLLLDQTIACFASDPDQLEVRAAVVLHLDPRLLPRNAETHAAREAAEAGEDEFEGLSEFVVFKMAFGEDDRAGLYMDGDPSCLVYQVEGASRDVDAEALARAWVGEGVRRVRFEHLPGVYQAAYVSHVRGTPVEADETQFMWAIPGEDDAAFVPVREFPPRTGATELTREPGTVSFGLLPRAAVDELYRVRHRQW